MFLSKLNDDLCDIEWLQASENNAPAQLANDTATHRIAKKERKKTTKAPTLVEKVKTREKGLQKEALCFVSVNPFQINVR